MAYLLSVVLIALYWISVSLSAVSNSSTITTSVSASSNAAPATLPLSGSGTSYALACQSAFQSWFIAEQSFQKQHGPVVTTVTEEPAPGPGTPTASPYYLCDGIPRYNQTKPWSTYLISTSVVLTQGRTFPEPAPRCSIQPSDCNAVMSFYNSILKTANGSYTYYGICTPIITHMTTGFCGSCTFEPSHVQLLYWPVTTTNGDLCLRNGSTITQTPTGIGPNTAVVNGTTFTSPTVYMAYDTLAAKNFCGKVGNIHTNGIIALNPTDVSSMPASGIPGGGLKPTRVNYADLPPNPVPWAVYSAQVLPETPDTFTDFGNLSTIWNDYAPFLSIPVPQARAIDPAWSSCNFYPQFDALFDPPHALESVTSQLVPTSAAGVPLPAPPIAEPASNVVPEMPSKTPTQSDPVNTSVDPQPSISQVAVDPQSAPPLLTATPSSSAPHGPNKPHNSGSPASIDPHLNCQSSIDPQRTLSLQAVDSLSSVPVSGPHGIIPVASLDPHPTVQSGSGSPSPKAVASAFYSPQVQQPPSQGAGQSRQPEGDPPVQAPASATSPRPILYPEAVITIGSQAVTAVASRPVIIDGSTFFINAPAAIIPGETIYLPSAAGARTSVPTQAPTPYAILTLGSQTFTAIHDSGFSNLIVIGSATIIVGGPATTINGQNVKAESWGVIINGNSRITFSEPAPATLTAGGIGVVDSSSIAITSGATTPVMNAVLTLGSQTLTAMRDSRSNNLIIIGSATLIVGGPAATIDGQTVSVAPAGVVLNSVSTIPLPKPSSAISAGGGIGGIIMSMLEPWASPSGTVTVGNSTTAPTQSIEPYRGGALGRRAYEGIMFVVVALMVALM